MQNVEEWKACLLEKEKGTDKMTSYQAIRFSWLYQRITDPILFFRRLLP